MDMVGDAVGEGMVAVVDSTCHPHPTRMTITMMQSVHLLAHYHQSRPRLTTATRHPKMYVMICGLLDRVPWECWH